MKKPEEILQGAICSATQACRNSLGDCIQFEELMQNEWAENRLADFNLWASGVGASVQGKASSIVRYVDWFESKDNYYIVTDLFKGDDLFDHITEKGKLTEPNALRALNDILAAVEYLHHYGIVHRHLALQKFRYLTKDESYPLMLISLAHADWEKTEARYIIPWHRRTSASKDKHFGECAPEIMRQKRSGKPADMWSIGVIAYMMLAGYSPFRSESVAGVLEECTAGSIAFHERYWKGISTSAKDFIRRLLQPKPEDRLTIEEAKRHSWIP